MTEYTPVGQHSSWFQVTPPGSTAIHVCAANWLHALGLALAAQGRAELESLASEVLPNGTALIRDIRRSEVWLVRPAAETTQRLDGDGVDTLLPTANTEEIDEVDALFSEAITEELHVIAQPGGESFWVL